MSKSRPYLSVIIPTYNGAEVLPQTLLSVDHYLSGQDYPYEIIVVKDGSTDNTAEIVRSLAGSVKNLRLADNSENQGKGSAIRQGMLLAEGEWRLFMDDDNSTQISEVAKLLSAVSGENNLIAIGSRGLRDSALTPPAPWYRGIAGKFGNLVIQVLLLSGIWDTQCGFKLFSGILAEKIFSKTRLNGWACDLEMLALGKSLGASIKEIPISWADSSVSRIKPMAYLKFLKDLCKIRAWLWLDKYNLSAEPQGRII